jgi:hypothetical protein
VKLLTKEWFSACSTGAQSGCIIDVDVFRQVPSLSVSTKTYASNAFTSLQRFLRYQTVTLLLRAGVNGIRTDHPLNGSLEPTAEQSNAAVR